MDALLANDMSKRELKVALAVCRQTYGYADTGAGSGRKRWDDLTMTRVAEITGLTRPHASQTVRSLIDCRVLLERTGKHGKLLSINENTTRWHRPETGRGVPKQDVPKQDGESQNRTSQNRTPRPETGHVPEQDTPSRNRTQTVPKQDGIPSRNGTHKEKTNKDKTSNYPPPISPPPPLAAGAEADTSASSSLGDEFPVGFVEFWSRYPKKVGKREALKAWKKVKPGQALTETILTAVDDQKTWERWTRDEGRYIPNPATWLNQGRWDDEPDRSRAPRFADKDYSAGASDLDSFFSQQQGAG